MLSVAIYQKSYVPVGDFEERAGMQYIKVQPLEFYHVSQLIVCEDDRRWPKNCNPPNTRFSCRPNSQLSPVNY